MADKVINLNLRLPPQLHARLVEQARTGKRSLNGTILALLAGKDLPAAEGAGLTQDRPELRAILEVLAAVMDVAGRSRFGFDALYAPDSTPDWLEDPDGYAVAVAAAARALDALRPPPDAAAGDAEYAAKLAETNKSYGEAVAEHILSRVASDEPSDKRTAALREALGPLVGRIASPMVDPRISDFEPVWIRPMTAEQRARLEAQHAKARECEREEPKWPDEGDDEAPK
jgi:hypothetical protein